MSYKTDEFVDRETDKDLFERICSAEPVVLEIFELARAIGSGCNGQIDPDLAWNRLFRPTLADLIGCCRKKLNNGAVFCELDNWLFSGRAWNAVYTAFMKELAEK